MNWLQILGAIYVIGFFAHMMIALFGFAGNIAPQLKKPLRDFDIVMIALLAIFGSAIWPLLIVGDMIKLLKKI